MSESPTITPYAKRVFSWFISFAIPFIFLFSAGPARAQAPPAVDPANGRYLLTPYVDVLEDRDKKWSVSDVASPELAGLFVPNQGSSFKIMRSRSAYWLRFRLARKMMDPPDIPGMAPENWLLEVGFPMFGRIDLFIPMKTPPQQDGQGSYLVKKAGLEYDAGFREVRFKNYVFKLPDNFNQEAEFYLRLEDRIGPAIPLVLWTWERFHLYALMDFLVFGAVYGTLLSLLLFNLSIYFSLRDRVYLYYVFFLMCLLPQQLTIQGHLAILPGIPTGKFIPLFWIILGGTFFWLSLFAKSFLITKTNTPGLNKIYNLFIVLAVGITVLGLTEQFGIVRWIIPIIGIFLAPVSFFTAAVRLRQGFKPALFFLIAGVPVATGGMLFALQNAGIIHHSLFTLYTYPIGAALESILFSFALSARVKALREEKETLAASERRYMEMSVTDGLTGLNNKRYLVSCLADEIERSETAGRPLSLLMLDVDDFKKYNDLYGHPEGDRVLAELARVIRECVRDRDTACRYGGEEFTVILPQADVRNAAQVAERIRKRTAALTFSPRAGHERNVTVSIGLAQLLPEEDGPGLMKRADEALYQAKEQGKNRTVEAGDQVN